METLNGHVMNLANSIIGVSVLAMPYCFKQCGIILSVTLLLLSSIVSRLTCHFLLKSAILSRRKTFEFLAFHLFGRLGKLAIEIGMIGFLLGTCIAYFVVMGDLGPVIIAEVTKYPVTSTMHTSILMSLALLIVLPMGLLRNVHSLNTVSRATMAFYCCLVLKVIIEALPRLFEDNWYADVNLWRPEGLLQCVPIFSMALFCQTQLFEIYEVVPYPTLDKMNYLIKSAVQFCTAVYICVGIFGYIAFANKHFSGNILLSFEPSFISHIIKIGFILSVAFSFPLVIFPCRASLYSLLYKEGYTIHEGNLNYISEGKFKALTFIIVFVSLVIALLIPNIELVLGLVGSTIGIVICVLFPVTCFICISHKNTNERILAQILLALGIFVMVVGTYKNIQRVDNIEPSVVTAKTIQLANQNVHKVETMANKISFTEKLEIKTELLKTVPTENPTFKEIRHEPPQPVEPVEEQPKKEKFKLPDIEKIQEKSKILEPILKKDGLVNDTVDIEAIKKEDKEEQLEKKEKIKEGNEDDHKILIDTIQKQNEVQKEIVEQQKQLLEVIKQQQKKEDKKIDVVKQEKMKAVKEIESIALKAIEKISDGEDTKKVVDDLKKGLEENEIKIPNDKASLEGIKEKDTLKAKTDEQLNKETNEFEKRVDNFKMQIKELSSQLNQVNIAVKNKETSLKNSPDNKAAIENDLGVREISLVNRGSDKIKENGSEQAVHKPKLDDVLFINKNSIASNVNKSETKVDTNKFKIADENNPSRLVPIPIAVLNLKKNLTKTNSPTLVESKEKQNEILDNRQAAEVQAMRRDILSLSTKKK